VPHSFFVAFQINLSDSVLLPWTNGMEPLFHTKMFSYVWNLILVQWQYRLPRNIGRK
jgi:hypothetical protein